MLLSSVVPQRGGLTSTTLHLRMVSARLPPAAQRWHAPDRRCGSPAGPAAVLCAGVPHPRAAGSGGPAERAVAPAGRRRPALLAGCVHARTLHSRRLPGERCRRACPASIAPTGGRRLCACHAAAPDPLPLPLSAARLQTRTSTSTRRCARGCRRVRAWTWRRRWCAARRAPAWRWCARPATTPRATPPWASASSTTPASRRAQRRCARCPAPPPICLPAGSLLRAGPAQPMACSAAGRRPPALLLSCCCCRLQRCIAHPPAPLRPAGRGRGAGADPGLGRAPRQRHAAHL